MNPPHWLQCSMGGVHDPCLLGARQVRPDRRRPPSRLVHLMGSEDLKRVLITSLDQRSNLVQFNTSSHSHALLNCFHSQVILSIDHVARLAATAVKTPGLGSLYPKVANSGPNGVSKTVCKPQAIHLPLSSSTTKPVHLSKRAEPVFHR